MRACSFAYLLAVLAASVVGKKRSQKFNEVFSNVPFPCAANCADEKCFPSAWDEAAAESRHLTNGCTYVVYSAAIDDHADSFNPIENYWEKSHQSDLKCSILFISKNSVYMQQHSSDRKVGNWHIVTVGNLTGGMGFSDTRKASRVPKLSPGKFFADTVQYALYTDAKLVLLKHPEDLLSAYVHRANKTSLAFMGVAHHIHNLHHEVQLIDNARLHGRPGVTNDFTMVKHQEEIYAKLGITGSGLAIDGALIMSDLRSEGGRQFMCKWFNQVLKFGDRDQLAFQGALYYLSHGKINAVVDEEGMKTVALDTTDGRFYLRMLPAKYWWQKKNEYSLAHTRHLSWKP
jgi:hypothetical protein